MQRSFQSTAIFATVFLLTSTTAFAADPGVKCESGKLKEAAKYSSCRLKAESKAVKKSEAPDYSKCGSKFGDKWTKLEEKAQLDPMFNACPSVGDEGSMDARITSDATEISALLAGGCSDGALIAGSCWYLSEIDESCDAACAAVGKAYDEATRTYAGSEGNIVNCTRVLAALGLTPPTDILSVGPDEIGCMVDPNGWRWDPTNTTSSASWVVNQRACACQ